MDDSAAIGAFAALAHERRLSVYKLLGQCGSEGLNAGAVAERLNVPPSSLSFHLSQLEQAGLISSRRDRRQIVYSIVEARLIELIAYLIQEGQAANPAFRPLISERLELVS